MYDLRNMPYPVGSIVWFVAKDSIKRGEVFGIASHVTKQGIKTEWHIAEPTRQKDEAIIMHHVDVNGLAFDLENMGEKAQAKSWAFREMQRRHEAKARQEIENNKRN
jgi:hypothetical protein